MQDFATIHRMTGIWWLNTCWFFLDWRYLGFIFNLEMWARNGDFTQKFLENVSIKPFQRWPHSNVQHICTSHSTFKPFKLWCQPQNNVYIYNIHRHMYTFAYIHIYIYANIHVYIYTYIYVYMHTCIHENMYTYIRIHIHIYIYIYT